MYRMSLVMVLSVIELLMLVVTMTTVSGAAVDAEGGRAGLVDATAAVQRDNVRQRSELVSRRGWYGNVHVMPWNNQDMAWLKRAAAAAGDVDRRGWGNGIPPWMRRRVVVTARR